MRLAMPLVFIAAVPALAQERPAALPPLYVSLSVLQALDVHSTQLALSRGAREVNPLMPEDPAALAAVKVGVTLALIGAAERCWKQGHRKTAVLLVIGAVVGQGIVVAHNYRVAGQLHGGPR